MLDRLDGAVRPEDMNLPGYRFHPLKSARKGEYAVSVSGNWRITFALRLGVSRLTVSEILHEKRPLTPEMAARIAKLLNTSADSWLRMQAALDLWAIQQDPKMLAGIKPIKQVEYAIA